MTFKKTKLIMFFMSITSIVILWSLEKNKMIKMNFFLTSQEVQEIPPFITNINTMSMLFILMLTSVTMVVLKYSEMYMEHYNNKKFFTLLLSFFMSMLLLSMSGAMMNTMMGWEFLGLTSLCLIMFYPNKIGMINSIMTMTFNRMGDIFMITILSLMLVLSISSFSISKMSYSMSLMFLISSLTKSAQFPLSAWLPAAMSAPTPISAMVHSSTLVTAGIFLMIKLQLTMMTNNLMEFLMALSLISFFLGGLMSSMEMDLKKMIAFSTMSQISMIMLMCAMMMKLVSLTHMFYHAMFKTLLFCTAGTMFMMMWGEQKEKKMKISKKENLKKYFLLASIYSMTGLIYSSSFYTKDLFLEMMMYKNKNTLTTMFMILAGMMTIMYCMKMMSQMKKTSSNKNNFKKLSNYNKISLFVMITLTMEKLSSMKMMKNYLPQISMEETLVLFMMMSVILMFNQKKIKKIKMLMKMTSELMFMKFQLYSFWSKKMKNNTMKNFYETDLLIFKKYYFKMNLLKMEEKMFVMSALMILYTWKFMM